MSDVLVRIKRAVLAGRFEFSRKAADEMDADDLTRLDVAESIVNAVAIYKTIRSRNPQSDRAEKLHIIQSTNLRGVPIYTKGKLVTEADIEKYYSLSRPREPCEGCKSHDRPQDVSNVRKPPNPARAADSDADKPRQAVHSAQPDISRVPAVWRTGVQPGRHGEDRGAPPEAPQGRGVAPIGRRGPRVVPA